jgi:hypothetical protein
MGVKEFLLCGHYGDGYGNGYGYGYGYGEEDLEKAGATLITVQKGDLWKL